MEKICNHCKQLLAFSLFNKSSAEADGYSPRCRECSREFSIKYRKKETTKEKLRVDARRYYHNNKEKCREKSSGYRQELRNEFLTEYGGVCSCCGEANQSLLTVQHIKGGGNKHRRDVGGTSTGVLYDLKKRGWPKDDFEILCFNCNMASSNGRLCPHKVKSRLSIFLDMDGTILNFVGRVCEVLGLNEESVLKNWPLGSWNICEAIKVPEKDLWAKIDGLGESFWSEMKPYDWCDELFQFCQQIAPTFILSKPTHHPSSLSGKVKWLQKWKGKDFSNFILTSNKEMCSRKGSILIDDHDFNIERFSKFDGESILFPMHANSRYYLSHKSVEVVKYELFKWYKKMLRI
jgi:5'(3')-deoxyribonucleotidase